MSTRIFLFRFGDLISIHREIFIWIWFGFQSGSEQVVGQFPTKHGLLLSILVWLLRRHLQNALIWIDWWCLARNVVVRRTEEVHDGLVGVEALIG